MRRFVLGLGLLISGMSASAFATTMPLNHLHLQDDVRVLNQISHRDFHNIIGEIAAAFSPIVRHHGGELKVNYFWTDPTVNASAQQDGRYWILNMYGGLARRKEITKDGFAMVVCHELGHHLGGYPFKYEGTMGWAASEGQSDYFASQTCARLIWGRDMEENAKFRALVDPFAKAVCDRNWKYQTQRDLCYRISRAGESLANLLNVLQDNTRPVAYRKANRERVAETYVQHPHAQCRLETYLNGALCRRPFNLAVIPGKTVNTQNGAQMDQEKEAAMYSCQDMGSQWDGSRPTCWFRPENPSW